MPPLPKSIKRLVAPRSVAVIGATEKPQHGSMAFRNLTRAGFKGRVFAVNPRYQTIFGHTCYPDLASLPEVPDCAVLAIAAAALPDLLRQAGELGVRAAVIFSAGFAEVGAEGRALQDKLAEVANRYGIAVCGPNCMGIVNVVDRTAMFTGLVSPELPRGRVGVIAQSGSVAYVLMNSHRLACSKVISSGNQAVSDAADYLGYLVDDDDTDTIALFIEDIPRPDVFLGAVVRAHKVGKPIVICRPGRSRKSAEVLIGHTGTLAGSYEVFTAFCRQFGLIQADDLDEMVETLVLLSGPRRTVKQPTLGAINCSGGENALIMDMSEVVGVDMPTLAPDTAGKLRQMLPSFGTVSNPLDVTGMFFYDGDGFRRCMEVLARDPGIGMVMTVLDTPIANVPTEAVGFNRPIVNATATAARELDKPVVFMTCVSGEVHPDMRAILDEAQVPILHGTRKGLQAVRHFLHWTAFVERLRASGNDLLATRNGAKLPPPAGLADAIAAAAGKPVGEYAAKRVLEAFGLPVVREKRATSAAAAVAAARQCGFPVSLKIDSPDLPHKTDVGGVALGLATEVEVADAFTRVMAEVERRAPAARIDGVLVQQMARGGTEMIVGMKRDKSFGPVVLVGLGGVFVEVLKTFAIACAPFDAATARELIAGLAGASVLKGARGAAPRDIEALAQFLARFSQFAAAADDVREIDLNPVFVLPEGQGVVIADALIVA